MIIQARNYRYEIKRSQGITTETFTKRYALAALEDKLITARKDLEALPPGNRRRQREKIQRLEKQTDILRLTL